MKTPKLSSCEHDNREAAHKAAAALPTCPAGPPFQMSAAKTQNPPNELLEKLRNAWMDRRTPSAAVEADQELETVGAVHRAANIRG